MIKITDVAEIKWTKERASVLKSKRVESKLSLRDMVEKMAEHGCETNHMTIHNFENAKVQKISIEYLEALCEALSIKMAIFFDSFCVGVAQKKM